MIPNSHNFLAGFSAHYTDGEGASAAPQVMKPQLDPMY